jgi:predicted DCC family thiol-disulfide oxidoreductase YuxK
VFSFLPTFINDYIYDFIAKNRYHWFGKEDSCDTGILKSGIIKK